MEAHVEVLLGGTGQVGATGNDVIGHTVVDVEQGGSLLRSTLGHELRHGTIEIDLAGYGNATAGETAVDIAGLELKDGLPCGPALVGKDGIVATAQVVLVPVHDGQLQLSHLVDDLGIGVTLAQLSLHVLGNGLDLGSTVGHLLILALHVQL